jgi:translation initiation factor IF-3
LNKLDAKTLLNEEIDFPEIRCIGSDGGQLGLLATDEALKIAKRDGLDLVVISPTAIPPVCKIMDYNKYRYEHEKKLKEAKKKQKIVEVKELKLSIKIAQNDISYKIKHAREFIEDSKHVKFRVVLKGRESENPKPGIELLNHIWELLSDIAERDKEPTIDGRFISMMIVPRKIQPKKKGESNAKDEDK